MVPCKCAIVTKHNIIAIVDFYFIALFRILQVIAYTKHRAIWVFAPYMGVDYIAVRKASERGNNCAANHTLNINFVGVKSQGHR